MKKKIEKAKMNIIRSERGDIRSDTTMGEKNPRRLL